MLAFVLANKDDILLKEDSLYSVSKTAVLAPSLVAPTGFTTISSNWHYVELISGEYDEQIPQAKTEISKLPTIQGRGRGLDRYVG